MYLQDVANKETVFIRQYGKEKFMRKEESLTKEISQNASLLPLECKEHVLDLIKAMVFTKKVITKNKDQADRKAG